MISSSYDLNYLLANELRLFNYAAVLDIYFVKSVVEEEISEVFTHN